MAEDERPDSPEEETNLAGSGAAGEPSEGAGEAEAPAAEDGGELAASGAAGEPADAQPDEPAPVEEPPAAEEEPAPPAAEEEPAEERPRRRRDADEAPSQPDVVPGAHLEPDLVLEAERREAEGEEYDPYAPTEDGDSEAAADVEEQPAPVPRTTIDLAADARYKATGKRKTAIARVVVRPGSGAYQINGRSLEEFFPRQTLQRTARQPLETAGYDSRMDVVARIQGGGVSAQAGALRHGIARALVEADPNLRTELKRRGFLTRDAREKERKKAGLKKARKRPQFSKR
jgi:small subunit ribosomal protein S9